MIKFSISDDYIQLNSLLKATNLCDSGGMAKSVIDDGVVVVNSVVEFRRRYKARVGDIVEFAGEKIMITKDE